jgi:hypothetical protein
MYTAAGVAIVAATIATLNQPLCYEAADSIVQLRSVVIQHTGHTNVLKWS